MRLIVCGWAEMCYFTELKSPLFVGMVVMQNRLLPKRLTFISAILLL